ncbi:MAG: WD40 repeat domain-containing protein, partial [Planctomycetota bacterium]
AQLWDAASGSCVATLETPHFVIADAAFDPNGRHLATSGMEKHVVVWRTRDGSLVADQYLAPLVADFATGLAFTAGGRLLAAATRGQLLLFDLPR